MNKEMIDIASGIMVVSGCVESNSQKHIFSKH